jgi:hypothetical protein
LKNKSTCYNNIRIKELKKIMEKISEPMSNEINSSFKNCKYPIGLDIIKILPIFKSGRKSIAENYRPISVTTNFSKIIDSLVYKQLNTYLEDSKIIHNNQYGFKKKHSTVLQIIKMMDKVYKNSENKIINILLFIDLKQAFASVTHSILLTKYNKLE